MTTTPRPTSEASVATSRGNHAARMSVYISGASSVMVRSSRATEGQMAKGKSRAQLINR